MKSKEEILTDLYALRATLSALSVEKDNYDKLESKMTAEKKSCDEKLHKASEKLRACNTSISKDRAVINNKDNELKKINAEYTRRVNEITDAKSKAVSNASKATGFVLLGILCAIGCLGVGAAFGLYFYHYWIAKTFANLFFPVNILALLGGLVSAVGMLASVVGAVIVMKVFIGLASGYTGNKSKAEQRRDAAKDRDNAIAAYESKCAVAEHRLSLTLPEKDVYVGKVENLKKEKEEINDRYVPQMLVPVANSRAIDEFASNTYGSLLSVSDWIDLDLIIYYMETNRADDIKEALQLKDRQRQNDELVRAVNNAGKSISDTISRGFSQMQQNMVKCFALISKQIQIVSEQQAARMKELSRSVNSMKDSINSSLASLGASINVQNALQAKANATSAALVSDMNYMRTLADNAEVRRRNNLQTF